MKRSPFQRKTPMQRGQPIARVPLPRVPSEPTSKPKRKTPPPVPTALATMVLERAGWCCDRCGVSIVGREFSRQHRRARGAGGRREGAHTPANLIVLCGSATSQGCHEWAEHSHRTEAYELGFAIRGEARKPEDVPVFRHLRQWVIPGDGVWIDADESQAA